MAALLKKYYAESAATPGSKGNGPPSPHGEKDTGEEKEPSPRRTGLKATLDVTETSTAKAPLHSLQLKEETTEKRREGKGEEGRGGERRGLGEGEGSDAIADSASETQNGESTEIAGKQSIRFGLADERGRVLLYISVDVNPICPLSEVLPTLHAKFKIDKNCTKDYLFLKVGKKVESEGSCSYLIIQPEYSILSQLTRGLGNG